MKTNEFMEQVTDMGYRVYKTKYWVCILSDDDIGRVAEVSRTFRYGVSIIPQRRHRYSSEFTENILEEVIDLVMEYAHTPIDERE